MPIFSALTQQSFLYIIKMENIHNSQHFKTISRSQCQFLDKLQANENFKCDFAQISKWFTLHEIFLIHFFLSSYFSFFQIIYSADGTILRGESRRGRGKGRGGGVSKREIFLWHFMFMIYRRKKYFWNTRKETI